MLFSECEKLTFTSIKKQADLYFSEFLQKRERNFNGREHMLLFLGKADCRRHGDYNEKQLYLQKCCSEFPCVFKCPNFIYNGIKNRRPYFPAAHCKLYIIINK
jgi:hypothetical protein